MHPRLEGRGPQSLRAGDGWVVGGGGKRRFRGPDQEGRRMVVSRPLARLPTGSLGDASVREGWWLVALRALY